MNYKIVKTADEYPDVLIHRDTDTDGQEIVRIMAIGRVDDEEDCMTTEDVLFGGYETPRFFVADFSVTSAERWCKKEGIYF